MFFLDGIDHVFNRKLIREEFLGIDPHAQVPLEKSAKEDLTDARYGLEAVLDVPVDIIHQVLQGKA